jgi:hypothetical protein
MIWICKPIPLESVVRNQSEVLYFRGGASNDNKIPQILLEKFFPDWETRINYQNHQEIIFQRGNKKIQEGKRLQIVKKIKLTPEEQDAFDYFNGIGFYKYYQDSKTLPNRFDTRQSFLLKMQDKEMRTNFLNSYNSYNN